MNDMDTKIVNGYVEVLYKSIPITDKTDIKVLTSEDTKKDTMLIDIRKYSLYGNMFDGVKRPTKKGIKFKLHNTKGIIIALLDILMKHNMLERTIGGYIVDLIKTNVRE